MTLLQSHSSVFALFSCHALYLARAMNRIQKSCDLDLLCEGLAFLRPGGAKAAAQGRLLAQQRSFAGTAAATSNATRQSPDPEAGVKPDVSGRNVSCLLFSEMRTVSNLKAAVSQQ